MTESIAQAKLSVGADAGLELSCVNSGPRGYRLKPVHPRSHRLKTTGLSDGVKAVYQVQIISFPLDHIFWCILSVQSLSILMIPPA